MRHEGNHGAALIGHEELRSVRQNDVGAAFSAGPLAARSPIRPVSGFTMLAVAVEGTGGTEPRSEADYTRPARRLESGFGRLNAGIVGCGDLKPPTIPRARCRRWSSMPPAGPFFKGHLPALRRFRRRDVRGCGEDPGGVAAARLGGAVTRHRAHRRSPTSRPRTPTSTDSSGRTSRLVVWTDFTWSA